jgi:hypothetical protein
MTPSSGPVGLPFTITGTGFGASGGSNTRVKIGGVAAPLSLWNDTTITGTIPGLAAGSYPVVVERQQGADVQASTVGAFAVTAPQVYALAPSSGPIGASFTLSGESFGPYAGSLSVVLVGGTTAPLSLWNDATIKGTIPGALSPGSYPLVAVRLTADGGRVESSSMTFQVAVPFAAQMAPSTGPVGIPFTLTGSGFGAYAGSNTRVRIGGVLAPLSLWNDTTITGTIPGLSTGTYTVCVEIQQGADVVVSTITAFGVVAPQPDSLTPTSGPIGAPFTITGAGFGPYAGSLTRVLIGGVAAPLSLWNDAKITGTVPGAVAAGTQTIVVERATSSGFVVDSDPGQFFVSQPEVSSLAPSSAPIGAPFTIHGTSFGSYAGSLTTVLIGGVAAPLSLWNDTTITGTVPGQLSAGAQSVVVRRTAGGVNADAAAGTLTVVVPVVSTITPNSGDAGSAFELDGAGFGPYAGSLTKVLVGGVAASLSLWNDTVIRGVIPDSLAVGTYTVVVVRSPAGGTVESEPVTFTVGSPIGGASLAAAAPASAQPSWYYEAALTVPAAEGGTVVAPSHASVQLPPAAVPEDVTVTIEHAASDTPDEQARVEEQQRTALGKAGEPVEYGPSGTQFSAPVTIELPYDPRAVPFGKESEVAVHYWDPIAKNWQPLPSELDPVHHRVRAKTSHFSLYQPLIPGVVWAQAASSTVDTVQVACNPLRPGCRPMGFQNLPAGARLRLYTLAGNLVKDFSADGAGTASWDGTNQDGQPVASGVYLLYAQGAGGKKKLKVAVQR